MLTTKKNSNIYFSLLNLSYLTLPLPYNLINYLISKPMQNIPRFILIISTQFPLPIQLIYNFQTHIIPQGLFPTPNPLNFRQSSRMIRYACKGSSPLSHTILMAQSFFYSDNPG